MNFLVTETRPYLQGLRLTSYELGEVGASFRVLVDNAVAWAMTKGLVDVVVVGSDTIAMDGSVANKIGTLQIAIAAKSLGIPFYVYGGRFDFNPRCITQKDIRIEERPPGEILTYLHSKAHPYDDRLAAWNPAFDVTPHYLITKIIGPNGVYEPNEFAAKMSTSTR